MDIMQLPLVRKIGDLFRRSILLLHFSWISRIAQLLQVIISLFCTFDVYSPTLQLCLIGRAVEKTEVYILGFRLSPRLTFLPGRFRH